MNSTEYQTLPLGYPASVLFLDESGSKGSGGQFFVVAGIKTRHPGDLLREVWRVRDHYKFYSELKFAGLTRNTLPLYHDLINVIAQSDAHIKAYVIDKRHNDPFVGKEQWETRVEVTSQLTLASINKGELLTLLIDDSSTPVGISIPERVREQVNNRLGCTALASAMAVDSRATDALQIADLVAGAIHYERRRKEIGVVVPSAKISPKAHVAQMLAAAFGIPDFSDIRQGRVSILTNKQRRRKQVALAPMVVPES